MSLRDICDEAPRRSDWRECLNPVQGADYRWEVNLNAFSSDTVSAYLATEIDWMRTSTRKCIFRPCHSYCDLQVPLRRAASSYPTISHLGHHPSPLVTWTLCQSQGDCIIEIHIRAIT